MPRSLRRLVLPAVAIMAVAALALAAREEALAPADPTAEARAKLAARVYEELRMMTQEMATAPPGGRDQEYFLNAARAERFCLWSRRWMEAERDRAPSKDARVAAARAHLDRIRALESGEAFGDARGALAPEQVKAMRMPGDQDRLAYLDTLEFCRLEAESWLARAEAE